VNRITGANFNQQAGGVFDKSAGIDFSVSNLSYDGNGNIQTMNQTGYKVGGSSLVDQLTYTYRANSNVLLKVADAIPALNTKLGDFHDWTNSTDDYKYDGNGNLITDSNRQITSIGYDFINLPETIPIKGKGTITFTYDAAGNKLRKQTLDTAAHPNITTVTLYDAGFVYQNDTLQFVGHEEGRARWAYHKYTNGSTAYGYEYDFFEKDHLGNTREVLTQQKDTAKYIATMEGAFRATETQLFGGITNTVVARNLVAGYPADLTFTNPNDSVSKLNGNGPRLGPNLLLKVMSGDQVDLMVQYFFTGTGSAGSPVSSLNDVLNSLAGGIMTMTSGAKGALTDFTNPAGVVSTGLTSFLTGNESTPATKPKAYLNWMLLDEQFKYVSGNSQSGALPVVTPGPNGSALQSPLAQTGINISKNGYLYIWVSNETPAWDVEFDNLSVVHRPGPLLEETHYYPFGLTMAGISSKALKPKYAQNNYKYNGKELLNQEFSDATGLEEY